jgi:osmotically inducible protein OsmC
MAVQSSATTVWHGDLGHGSGETTPESGAYDPTPVSWASRTKRAAGKTSPEELLAAAHAACFCMGLSHELGEAGTPPDSLEATATVEFVPGEGVKTSHIVVTGHVPGIDQATFEAAAGAAGEGCPISGAMKGNVEITVDATLAAEG